MSGNGAADQLFTEAIAGFRRIDVPFWLAVTLLEYAEWLPMNAGTTPTPTSPKHRNLPSLARNAMARSHHIGSSRQTFTGRPDIAHVRAILRPVSRAPERQSPRPSRRRSRSPRRARASPSRTRPNSGVIPGECWSFIAAQAAFSWYRLPLPSFVPVADSYPIKRHPARERWKTRRVYRPAGRGQRWSPRAARYCNDASQPPSPWSLWRKAPTVVSRASTQRPG